MPSQVEGPEGQLEDESSTSEQPEEVSNGTSGQDKDEQTLLGHDELVALRSSRHVARRPRRRKRWPWVLPLVLAALGAVGYLVLWPIAEDFMVTRELSSATVGYPTVTAELTDGVVNLTGEVRTVADVEAIVSAVEIVEGVTEVRSALTVTLDPPDDPLETAVLEALAEAGITTVTPQVSGSTVTLVGFVDDPALIDSASSISVAVEGVSQILNRIIVADDLATVAQETLNAAGYSSAAVTLGDGVAVLSGNVPTDEDVMKAADVVLEVAGIDKVDNRLTVGTPTEPEPDEPPGGGEITDLDAALAAAGFANLTVSFDGDTAYLDGVVPFEVLEAGYFAFVDEVRVTVQDFSDATEFVNRLRLRGNESELRAQLQALIDATPIIFLSGSSDLTLDSQVALDAAAQIILSQPGLQVFIAGHTDSSGTTEANEQLARSRGGAVFGYLVAAGVPSSRLAVVSYGELFPGETSTAADARRIEFEVGP